MIRHGFSLMVILLALSGAGCGLRGVGTESADPEAILRREGRTTMTAPGPIPEDATDLQLLPEDLKGRLGFHEFRVIDTNVQTSITAVLENLQANDPLTLELAARFEDESGVAVFQTPWSRVTIQPHKKHHFFAETLDVRSSHGKILVKVVERIP